MARQLVEPPALLRGLSGGGRLDEVVDAEVVRTRVLEDGQALAAQVPLRRRNPQVGDGLHSPCAHEMRIPALYLTDAAHGTRHVPWC